MDDKELKKIQFNRRVGTNKAFCDEAFIATMGEGCEMFLAGINYANNLYSYTLGEELQILFKRQGGIGEFRIKILSKIPDLDVLNYKFDYYSHSLFNRYTGLFKRPKRAQLKNTYFLEAMIFFFKNVPFLYEEWFKVNNFKDMKLEALDAEKIKGLVKFLHYHKDPIFERLINKITGRFRGDSKVKPKVQSNETFRENFKRDYSIYIEHYLKFYLDSMNTQSSHGFYFAKSIFDSLLKDAFKQKKISSYPSIDFLFTEYQLKREGGPYRSMQDVSEMFAYWKGFADFFRYAVFLYQQIYIKNCEIPDPLPTPRQCLAHYYRNPKNYKNRPTNLNNFLKHINIEHGHFGGDYDYIKYDTLV